MTSACACTRKSTATVKVNVARSADEAERQAKGENVIASAAEADRADAAAQAKELAAHRVQGRPAPRE